MRLNDRIHSGALPASYYAEHRRDRADFAEMDGDIRADVAIVGGGFSGTATALMLAQKGMDVVLLEQNQIGWGASGRNGGQLIGGIGDTLGDEAEAIKAFGADAVDSLHEMGVECVCIVRQLIREHDIACDLKWGYFDAARTKAEMRALEAQIAGLKQQGYPHHTYMVRGEQTADVIGGGRFIGGAVNMGWGHLQPLDLVRGEARAAERLGARVLERSLVQSVEERDGDVRLETDKGQVIADTVLLAGNAYLGPLDPELRAKICPVGSYMVATEPLSDDEVAETLPSDYAVCDQRTVLDYWRLSADKRLLFGGMANYGGGHPREITRVMRARLAKVFPKLKHKPISHAWGGNIGVSVNRLPQLGRTGKRTFFAQGYSGHGLAPSHMLARLVSEAIAGQHDRFDIMARLPHKPFPGGPFKHQLLALGMLYYRLRDWLA